MTTGTNTEEKVQALKDYLVKSDGLIRILEKETEYYKENKVTRAEKLVESKQSIVSKLEEYKAKLISDVSFLKRLPADVKERIKKTTSDLGKAAEDNYREAVRAKEVNKVVLESVAKALMEAKKDSKGYSNEGDNGRADKSASSPVAINESV